MPEETKVEAPKAPGKSEAPKAPGKSEAPKADAPEAAPRAGEAAPKAPAGPVEARPCVVSAPAPPAKPAAPAKAARVGTTTEWYGWETAIMDAAAAAAFFSGVNDKDSGMAPLGIAIYLLGSPSVHGVKGQWAKAGASLGMRLTLPVVGAYAGSLLAPDRCRGSESGSGCGAGEAVAGFLIGSLVPPLVDAFLLGKKEVPAKPASVSWQPTILPVREGAAVGLVGTF